MIIERIKELQKKTQGSLVTRLKDEQRAQRNKQVARRRERSQGSNK